MGDAKPVIGIILDINNDSQKYLYSARTWYALRACYSENVEKVGGIPVILPYNQDISGTLKLIDGLIIPGCDKDIHPKFYGREIMSDKVKTKDSRTEYELEFTKRAIDKNIPVLGICNGLQLINVIFGGTLIQHIPEYVSSNLNHEQPPPKNVPTHSIVVKKGTILSSLAADSEIMVNSTHHQAIDDLGKGLVASAFASDGIIEAIESKDYKFLVGVQWHAEYLNSSLDNNLFKRLIEVSSLRRNRRTNWLRDLMAESTLRPEDLVLPIFVVEGENQRQEIATMPGVYRQSIDQVLITVKEAEARGIKAIALFPSIEQDLKSENADEAYNLDNLVCRTIRTIKNHGVEIGISCDVALDPYTIHGHDGVLVDNDVDNDRTIDALSNQALVLAKAGADIIAPSDMMDGRIMAIREELDANDFTNVNILAYAAKYNSSFYGPFRQAVKSDKKEYLSKATYQMDIRNIKEAMREIEQDITEGADMIMVKPGMPYLDVIREASGRFDVHIFAYQVSGEYSMLKIASEAGALEWEKVIVESLISFKRAGASGIFTYAALEVADMIK
ncbi:unnamed protein product [Rotaria magnacalcarata]|uniref:Delta-aminolevulinic acid dehydratase n=2 Tax=Rotaria magnacalcarata TaxID=392030 RepID=A0A818ZK89_9BILA|nr:unnamed protein product [Rotaria magnacalcarata]